MIIVIVHVTQSGQTSRAGNAPGGRNPDISHPTRSTLDPEIKGNSEGPISYLTLDKITKGSHEGVPSATLPSDSFAFKFSRWLCFTKAHRKSTPTLECESMTSSVQKLGTYQVTVYMLSIISDSFTEVAKLSQLHLHAGER